VSADYDRVLGFFEFTQRFFDRLSMIEQEKNRPPKPAPFQRCVVRVFSSMLTICAVAQDMKKEARFSMVFPLATAALLPLQINSLSYHREMGHYVDGRF
jgi:hypothetical protein